VASGWWLVVSQKCVANPPADRCRPTTKHQPPSTFHSPFSTPVPTKLDSIISELRDADVQDRIELLIDFARSLPPLPERLVPRRDAAHRVEECQTPVYLFVELTDGSRAEIHADVPIETPTVRGFVSILVEGLNGATVEEVLGVPTDLVDQVGLPEIVGMLRVRGLTGVLMRLKREVTRAAIERASGAASESTVAPGTPEPQVQS
jgi:cysteine desulfuration protein SufE